VVTAVAAFAISDRVLRPDRCLHVVHAHRRPAPGECYLTQFLVTRDGVVHERLRDDEVCGCLLIFGLEGEMYFGSGVSLESQLEIIDGRVQPWSKAVVMRMNAGAQSRRGRHRAVRALRRSPPEARGCASSPAALHDGMFACMETCGLAQKIGSENIFR
jgi:hypothetical protein